LQYFREQPFYYTRTPPAMLDKPVDQFLFDAKRGFCEHYASSFVILMRMAGIPARVVTGYLGGELNTIGNYFIVRQSDAHAWGEVWLADRGWVRFDPTAVIPPSRVEQAQFRDRFQPSEQTQQQDGSPLTSFLKRLGFFVDNMNHGWNDWVVGYNPTKQKNFLDTFGMKDMSANSTVLLLFAVISIVIILIAFHLSRFSIRKPSPAQLVFRRFCRKLAKKGFNYSPAETAGHFAQRVTSKRTDLKQQIEEIVNLYNQLRYTKVPAENTLQLLENRVSQFKP